MSDSNSEPSRTELDNLGEFKLIEHLASQFTQKQQSTLLGIGDDAAVLIPDANCNLLVTSDMLLEGVHFDLSYTPLKHLGYKAIAVNISDIAAMNGICTQVTVNIGLSNRFSLEAIDALYEGIQMACSHYQCDLVGGDTTSSVTGLIISVTALGYVGNDRLVKRSGAKHNDLICVSGDLGAAYLGLQVLEREKQVFLANSEMQPQLDQYEYIVSRQLKAEARTDVVTWFHEQGIVPTAMIDVSDGLASDLLHICKQSVVGARVYEDRLPIEAATKDAALEFNLNPGTVTLHGGEDYELLFTVDQKHHQSIENQQGISVIGHITDTGQGAELVTASEEIVPLEAQGWRHF
ncbi:MAG: thiamine-monophosphate kinase [Cyclobacteriaceae bacterium]|nr:MAG: thiamine-monophosphate kinase [Cyclobacteriaceae bacterium]